VEDAFEELFLYLLRLWFFNGGIIKTIYNKYIKNKKIKKKIAGRRHGSAGAPFLTIRHSTKGLSQ